MLDPLGGPPPQAAVSNQRSPDEDAALTAGLPLADPRRLSRLNDYLASLSFDGADPAELGTALRGLIDAQLGNIPLPGRGATLARWRMLAAVAARDVGLIKLYEGHTDALAILAELGQRAPPAGSRWGVWAAEPPTARLVAHAAPDDRSAEQDGGSLVLHGVKAWCSGAATVSHALVTAWLESGPASAPPRAVPILAAVRLDQPGVSVTSQGWNAVGMRATASVDVHFDGVRATRVGKPGAYLDRAGFWHGGAGIAACWYGAAAAIAGTLRKAAHQRADPHLLAHLGETDVALAAAAALLRETAAYIDARPRANAQLLAMRTRLAVEAAATIVLAQAGRALGAGPLCKDAAFARAMADLPVFLRQSHAQRDLAALGAMLAGEMPADDMLANHMPANNQSERAPGHERGRAHEEAGSWAL